MKNTLLTGVVNADNTYNFKCNICQKTWTLNKPIFDHACNNVAPPYVNIKPPKEMSTIPDKQDRATPKVPPLTTRLANFTKAAISHAINGSPTCSQEQIDDRISICRTCPYFIKNAENNGETGICGHMGCGCNINTEVKYLNKLAWRDSDCPIGKWHIIPDEK